MALSRIARFFAATATVLLTVFLSASTGTAAERAPGSCAPERPCSHANGVGEGGARGPAAPAACVHDGSCGASTLTASASVAVVLVSGAGVLGLARLRRRFRGQRNRWVPFVVRARFFRPPRLPALV